MNAAPEESNYRVLPEKFNFGSMSSTPDLVGCARCGGAVGNSELYLQQHDTWHEALAILLGVGA